VSYVDKNLMSGEKVTYRTKLHWVVFFRPAIWLLVALFFFVKGSGIAEIQMFGMFVWLFVLTAIIDGIGALIKYSTSEFGLSNKRVLMKAGFIRRNSIEVLLSKVEGIQVKQSILGRVLDYGSIIVSGTGGMNDPFHKITNPMKFRRKVQEQIEATEASG